MRCALVYGTHVVAEDDRPDYGSARAWRDQLAGEVMAGEVPALPASYFGDVAECVREIRVQVLADAA